MSNSFTRAALIGSVSAVACALSAGAAWSQTESPTVATVIDDIIVTAQKREESIQDVPIAVSAFSAETLDALKIEGGSELLRAIPNVTFSKSNFSMYNFAIRGIGTKAISGSSDPAVAVSFNNSPLIRNRLFESEYLDVQRVEVLRGPQGTLYGRNATAGVVNMIPNLARPDFDALLKVEGGNFGSMRGQMMVNLPLSDTFYLRGAASMTKREGFDHNTYLDTKVNGRDLYSTRLSAVWEPSDRFNVNLIWEHFAEDDNRSRTGKQLCTTDPGPASVGAVSNYSATFRGRMSQGCLPGSLYADAAYGTPNGIGMSQVQALTIILGYDSAGTPRNAIRLFEPGVDPYQGVVQSKNLREISTSYDPKFQAENDVVQLNMFLKLADKLSLYSQTLYTKDDYYSTQDYNRYVASQTFGRSDNLYDASRRFGSSPLSPRGVHTDYQLGSNDRMLSVDVSKSDNRQFYQEFRMQSDFESRFNFSLGVNYIDFKSYDDYYVFSNLFNILADYFYNFESLASGTGGAFRRPRDCLPTSNFACIYVDKSPLSDLEGDGHNYFRSKNEVHTKSWAIFGEGYLELSPSWKVTAGLRYTDDRKVSGLFPSQLLLGVVPSTGDGSSTGGYVYKGYPKLKDLDQSWEAVTGRFVVDWKPADDLMLYASFAHGYKGGGANPPRADINPFYLQYQPLPEVFDPEYVDSFELGMKSSWNDGKINLNFNVFYVNYKDYQVSQIVDRISLNENFDAETYGAELEAVWRITPSFRIDANLGLLKTRIGEGETSIDVMNRTQGNPDWVVLRPWLQVPSNCIAPKALVERVLAHPQTAGRGIFPLAALCSGSAQYGTFNPDITSQMPFHLIYGFTYDPLKEAPNGGRGIAMDLEGNELPNAPRWTANIGAQYIFQLGRWDLSVRADYYRQADSYFRVYNTEYDRIRSWDNVNASMTLSNESKDFEMQLYVKNISDDAPIVDAFTNSDDTMLTTNVFTLDPRIIGFSLLKRF